MPPVPNITVRTDRFTSDGEFQLVYEVNESVRGKPKRNEFRWVRVETGEPVSGVLESETRASFWLEGYEFGQKVRKEVAAAEKRKAQRNARKKAA